MTVLYWLPNYNHQNRYASKNHWVDFIDLHAQTSLCTESNNKSMWQSSETNEKRSVSTVLIAFACLHIIYFDGNGFCCKLFSLSLSLLWTQWEHNCGIHVGISPPSNARAIEFDSIDAFKCQWWLTKANCHSLSLKKYQKAWCTIRDTMYIDISEACVCLQPVHPGTSCEVMTYWFGSYIDLGPKERWLSDLKGPFSRLIHPINVQEPTRHLPLSAWPISLDSAVRPVWVAMQHVTWVAGKHWKTQWNMTSCAWEKRCSTQILP